MVPLKPNSELARSLEFTAVFLEQNSELQVISQSYPRRELQMFMSNLDALLNLFKDKTGFAFALSTLQPSLLGPETEFMVTFHKVSAVDRAKLPNIDEYHSRIPEIAKAFTIQEFDEQRCDLLSYFKAMKEAHGMTPIGGLDRQILFYKDPTHEAGTHRTQAEGEGDSMLVESL